MNLDFIQDLWDKDSIIDNELLHNESTKIPALHAKYYKIYNNIHLWSDKMCLDICFL